jgi:hypothetical protein
MTIGTLVLLFNAVTARGQDPHCGALRSVTVSDSGIGALRLGLTAGQVRTRCSVVRDTMVPNWDFVELERVLFVLVGADTVQAAVDPDGRVVRIYVDTPKARTADGIGVGSPLRKLVRPGATGAYSEATFGITMREHCGLQFIMKGVRAAEQGTEVDDEWLRALPPGPTVLRIQIWGCSR